MNRTRLLLLALLTSCAPDSAPTPPLVSIPDPVSECANTPASLEPEPPTAGWHSMTPAPPSLGTLSFSWSSPSRLEVSRCARRGAPTPRLYLAIRWAGSSDVTVLSPTFDTHVAIDVSPPASARVASTCSGGQSAEGLLLAYVPTTETPDPTRDELVGVSKRPWNLFADEGAVHPFTWDGCGVQSSTSPMQLEADPRRRLTLCLPSCAEPLFDRTLVTSAMLTLSPERTDLWFWVLGDLRDVHVEVNGAVVPRDQLSDALWREGNNTVLISAGGLPPWTGEVVIPARDLQLQLHGAPPRIGDDFTITWSAPWATDSTLQVWPLDVQPIKAAYPEFAVAGGSFTAPFPQFPATRSSVAPTRAALRLTASKSTNGFTLRLAQTVTTPLAP